MAKKEIVDIDQNDTSELEKKLASHDAKEAQSTDQEIIKPKRSEISNSTKEKMEAMAKFGLKPETTAVTVQLQDDPKFHLDMICSRFKKDIKDVALQYVLEGIEKDLKKIGIFEPKK